MKVTGSKGDSATLGFVVTAAVTFDQITGKSTDYCSSRGGNSGDSYGHRFHHCR